VGLFPESLSTCSYWLSRPPTEKCENNINIPEM